MSPLYTLKADAKSMRDAASFAARLLRVGEVVALPTDTVYGLAVSARNAPAIDRLYSIKRRQARKPLAISVSDVHDVGKYLDVDGIPPGVLDELLPGPVTLLLRQRREFTGLHPESEAFKALPGVERVRPLAYNLNRTATTATAATAAATRTSDDVGSDSRGEPADGAGPADERRPTVLGVRVPDSDFVRAVSRELGDPLALTSANLSGAGDCSSVDEFQPLWQECAAVFDAGAVPKPTLASTVIDLSRCRRGGRDAVSSHGREEDDEDGEDDGEEQQRQQRQRQQQWPCQFRIVRSGWAVDDVRRVLRAHAMVEAVDDNDCDRPKGDTARDAPASPAS